MDWRYIQVHYGIYSGGVGMNWILLYIYLDAFDFDNFPFRKAVRTCHKCLAKSCQIHNFGYNLYNT